MLSGMKVHPEIEGFVRLNMAGSACTVLLDCRQRGLGDEPVGRREENRSSVLPGTASPRVQQHSHLIIYLSFIYWFIIFIQIISLPGATSPSTTNRVWPSLQDL